MLTGIKEFDKKFGGVPEGKLVVFVINPEYRLYTDFNLLMLSQNFLEGCFLVDVVGDLMNSIFPSISKKKINPERYLDINEFEGGKFNDEIESYLRVFKRKNKENHIKVEPIVYINGLQQFFMRQYDNYEKSIYDYIEREITTIGVLYDHLGEDFNERLAQEVKECAAFIMKILVVRVAAKDKAIVLKVIDDINEQYKNLEEIEISV